MAAATASHLPFSALAVVLVLVAGLPAASATRLGKRYRVGGPDGWCVPPPEDKEMYYVNWASPITFYVEDSIEFVYKNDSVIKVDKVGYYHCNETAGLVGPGTGAAAAPRDGSTLFLLDAPGYAYFASADLDHCNMGERLMINVLASAMPPAPSFQSPLQTPGPWSWLMSPSSPPAPAPSVADATNAGYSLAASPSHAIILVPVTRWSVVETCSESGALQEMEAYPTQASRRRTKEESDPQVSSIASGSLAGEGGAPSARTISQA
ncbi:early nodulin-like protein 17 [Phragmites australis]|uniref:early nodulin-like protein 17 n=1 Tax=Phragmites australis TaxID=29695 RepID=UPI002D775B81|nr:early nodulin-like protein 17 [Phragmites australis]